jgi:apolipoprotein N-acyltransferase
MYFVESKKFKSGNTKATFKVDRYTIAPLICFDGVFLTNYIRDIRPDVYIVTSNDVFGEGTILSRLHQAYSVLNARTMGIPVLHVTQNGPSCYVDSKGKLTNLTSPYEKAIGLSVSIP